MIRISKNQKKSKSKEVQSKNVLIIILAVVSVAAVGVAVWALTSRTADNNASGKPESTERKIIEVVKSDGTTETVEELTNTIQLPQFAWLNLDAGKKEQQLTFDNPPQNFACLLLAVVLMTVGMLHSGAVRITTVVPERLLGDADSDGSVSIYDATCIQRHLALYSVRSFDTAAADTDRDGELTIYDATCLQRYLAAYSVPYPIGRPINT